MNRTAMSATTRPTSLFRPQNGDSSLRVAMAASIDAHTRTLGSGEALRGPELLGDNSTTPHTANSLSGERDDVDGGSLPCAPELGLRGAGCPAKPDKLETDTRELIGRFLKEFTELERPRWRESEALSTMKRVVNRLHLEMKNMFTVMYIRASKAPVSWVSTTAKDIFSDGITNWGRIATLVAFWAMVSLYMVKTGRGSSVELVGQELSTYLLTDQRDWLISHNAWDGFVEFFREGDHWAVASITVLAIGATLGILGVLIMRLFCSPKDFISGSFDLAQRIFKTHVVSNALSDSSAP